MRLTRLWALVDGARDWLGSLFVDEPPLFFDGRRIDQELRRRPREGDDDYSAQYVAEVRQRIITGRPPERPLVHARPGLLFFRDALSKLERPRDRKGRWVKRVG